MPHYQPPKHTLTSLAVVAAVLYCSWPLGSVLNPVANRGLASNLEATGQPWNWLFTITDIICGVLVVWIAWRLYATIKRPRQQWLLSTAIIGFGLFGFLNAIDAVLPIDCVPTAMKCRSALEDPYFITHGIASIASTNGLTITLVALWWIFLRARKSPELLLWTLNAGMIVWFSFGIATGIFILLDKSSATSQHVFIVVCSLLTAAMPYLVNRARASS